MCVLSACFLYPFPLCNAGSLPGSAEIRSPRTSRKRRWLPEQRSLYWITLSPLCQPSTLTTRRAFARRPGYSSHLLEAHRVVTMPGTTKATPGLERKIKQLCEMGVSRAAAKSALRASKGDVAEVRGGVVCINGIRTRRQTRSGVVVVG